MHFRSLVTGPLEARLLTELERREIVVFSVARHRALLEGFSPVQLRDVLHGLSAKGSLLRIERGKYLVVPRAARGGWHEHPFVIATGIAPAACYISYWSALSFHNLTTQLPRAVYAALRETQKDPVTFQGWRYQFVHLAADKFYGFREHEFTALNGAATVRVPVAEPEKAILDALDNELLAGGMTEVIGAIRRGLEDGTLSADRFAECAARYPNRAVVARLGYILEHAGAGRVSSLLTLMGEHRGTPYLSTGAPRGSAPVDPTWGVRVNVPADVFDLDEVA